MMINTAIGNENVIATILGTVQTLESGQANDQPSLQSCEPGASG